MKTPLDIANVMFTACAVGEPLTTVELITPCEYQKIIAHACSGVLLHAHQSHVDSTVITELAQYLIDSNKIQKVDPFIQYCGDGSVIICSTKVTDDPVNRLEYVITTINNTVSDRIDDVPIPI